MTSAVDVNLNGSPLSVAVPAALVLRVERPLVGRRRHVSVDVPGRAGSWIFTEEPGDRLLSVPLDIQASSFEDRRAAVRDLAEWADVGGLSRLIFTDEPDRFHLAILDNEPDPEEWLVRSEPSLVFRAGPYAEALAISEELINIAAFPASGSFNIDDTVHALPVVEITPTNGTLTSFTLEVNGDALSWSGNLANGATLTISSLSDTVTLGPNTDVNLTGAFDPLDISMADVSGEFPILLPGSNPWSITRTGTATTATLRFLWRERFR